MQQGICKRIVSGVHPFPNPFQGDKFPSFKSTILERLLPLYPRSVLRRLAPRPSPTLGLFLGLIITLAAVVAYSWYITRQISGLRDMQNNLVARNRKDSLQLLRIQNDLNSVALAMRDMLDSGDPYPLTAWTAQFQRLREDLD